MVSTQKLCYICKYSNTSVDPDYPPLVCSHPVLANNKGNRECFKIRGNLNLCGFEGKWYQERDKDA